VSQEERYGSRDMAYSAWHRRLSTRRYVGIEKAQLLAMIDLDARLWVEYDDDTKEPLALIEIAQDVGQRHKSATVTQKLAERAELPAFLALYRLADIPNPADEDWPDIDRFRVKRLWPRTEQEWRICTPNQWAHTLLSMREWQAKRLDEVWPDWDTILAS